MWNGRKYDKALIKLNLKLYELDSGPNTKVQDLFQETCLLRLMNKIWDSKSIIFVTMMNSVRDIQIT
jgi:hypothetical protein